MADFNDLVNLLKAQGFTLLAAVVVAVPIVWAALHFLYEHRIAGLKEGRDELQSKVTDLSKQLAEIRTASSRTLRPAEGIDASAGGIAVHASLEMNAVVNKAIAGARYTVAIVGYWLPQWIENSSISAALEAGAVATVVVGRPGSASMRERSAELGAPADYGSKRMEDGALRLAHLTGKLPGAARNRLHVYEYEGRLSLLVIQADERVFAGVYLHGRSVSDLFVIESRAADTAVGRALRRELDAVIESSREISVEIA